jgi:hypothetical protein
MTFDLSNGTLSNDYLCNKLTIAIFVICIVISIFICVLVTIVCRYKIIVRYQSSRQRVDSIDTEANKLIVAPKPYQVNNNKRNQLGVSVETYEDHDPEPWVPQNQTGIRLWGISFPEPPTNRPVIQRSTSRPNYVRTIGTRVESLDITSCS